jgi:hypothetical protein
MALHLRHCLLSDLSSIELPVHWEMIILTITLYTNDIGYHRSITWLPGTGEPTGGGTNDNYYTNYTSDEDVKDKYVKDKYVEFYQIYLKSQYIPQFIENMKNYKIRVGSVRELSKEMIESDPSRYLPTCKTIDK